MRRRPHATARLGALALFSMLVACSTGGVRVAEDARFVVFRAGEWPEEVADLEVVRALLPRALVLPASPPEGFELAAVEVRLPAPSTSAMERALEARVSLAFQRWPEAGFTITYRGAPVRGGPPRAAGASEVVVAGAASAQIAERPASSAGVGFAFTSLWFRACGLDFQLTAGGPELWPREEVLALARAFIEGCES